MTDGPMTDDASGEARPAVLTLTEAERIAERVRLGIDQQAGVPLVVRMADRERLTADLDGLRHHVSEALSGGVPYRCVRCAADRGWPCPDARRYVAGLRRTAALYGVT